VPIVFLTGNGDIPMSVRAIKAGAADFLACKLNEGFGNQGVMGKAVELIGRQIRRKRI